MIPGYGVVKLFCVLNAAKCARERRGPAAPRVGKKPLLHPHHLFHTAAAVDALLGNPARATALLRKASGTGLPNYPVFHEDPHFHSLRKRPEFLSLMADLKREWEGYRQEFGRN